MTNQEQLLALVAQEIEEDRLVLPTLPDVAIRVRDEVESESGSAAGVAEIVATDPSLAARFIQMANSAMYAGASPVEDVKTAVTRLGATVVRNLVTSLIMQQMFQPTAKVLEKRFKALWEHSVQVAAISRVLAQQCAHLQADQAMLGGLVHAIGALPILALAEGTPDLLEDAQALDGVIAELQPKIGKKILESWGFPETLIPVAVEHEDLQRDPGPKADYVDVVIVAKLQTYAGTDHPHASLDWSEVPAFRKLGLEPDVQIMELEGTAESILEAKRMLN